MNFQDVIFNHSEFECIECTESTDDNRVTEGTQLVILVTVKALDISMEVNIDCSLILNIGDQLDSDRVVSELNWYALDCLEIPEFNVDKANKGEIVNSGINQRLKDIEREKRMSDY